MSMTTAWAIAAIILSNVTVDHRNYYTTKEECERVLAVRNQEIKKSNNPRRIAASESDFCVNVVVPKQIIAAQ